MSNKRLPRITADELIKVIERLNFIWDGGAKHRVYRRKRDKRRVIVPYHRGRIIPPGTIKQIINATGLTVEEFNKLRHGKKVK